MLMTTIVAVASLASAQTENASRAYLDCTLSEVSKIAGSASEAQVVARIDNSCSTERAQYRRLALAEMRNRGDSNEDAQLMWQMMENGHRQYMIDRWHARNGRNNFGG